MKGGYRVLNTIGLFVLGSFFFFTFPQGKNNKKSDNQYWVAAYIWPSCHHDERFGDMLWPEGIGEWEVIKKGTPRFEGHYQPRLPLWGYEMDNDPEVVERWIDVAIDHGVNVFVYDWYWFDGGPFLESALNDGFLKAKNNSKMQFYIMWANHDVKRNYWNVHKFKDDDSLLWDGAVDWENFKIIVDRVIDRYFKRPNYFKIDGKPVFSIFSIENLMESFGGNVEETRKALDYFREKVKQAGFPDLHIQWNQGGGSVMSKEAASRFAQQVKEIGFNSVAMYNMGGLNEDYLVYGDNSLKIRAQLDSILDVPVFPCVSIGWDDTPRFPAKGKKDVVHYHNTPVSFAALLFKAKEYADNHPDQPKLITINAWNEWVEGSYLLPDMLNGFGYLKAVKKVFGDKDESLALFSQNEMSGELFDLAKIKNGVRNRRISSYDRTGGNADNVSGIKPGEKRTIAEISGKGVINHIWITIAPPPGELSRNDIILRMYWDGNEYPSVESPIGPFFGQGWNEQYNYSSFPLNAGPVNGTGLSCYFAMPFEKGARIEIENQTNRNIDAFYFYVDYLETDKLPEGIGRFHAWYNHELTNALPEGENEWGVLGPQGNNPTGSDNYVFIETQGKGHFVGINYYVHSPTPMWYGEGDDMWFIDGEKIPSLIGTGTEDFFNTSWCPKEPYTSLFFGYPRVNDDVGWLGRTHIYRFFIHDPIFFENGIKGTIEHGHNNNLTLDLGSVAYWYQDKAMMLPPAPTKEQRKLMPFIGPAEIHKWRDAWRKAKGNSPTLWGNE